jgi:hypothetical protein
MSILAENYSAAEAYELISQFNATSSNFGAVHSMVSIPLKTSLPAQTVYSPPPILIDEKLARGKRHFSKT